MGMPATDLSCTPFFAGIVSIRDKTSKSCGFVGSRAEGKVLCSNQDPGGDDGSNTDNGLQARGGLRPIMGLCSQGVDFSVQLSNRVAEAVDLQLQALLDDVFTVRVIVSGVQTVVVLSASFEKIVTQS